MVEETSQFPNWFEQHRNQFPNWLEQQFSSRPFPDWLGQQHFIVKKYLLPFLDIVEFHNFELTCTEVCDSLSDVRHEITRHWMFTSFESKEIKVRRHAVRDCVHVREALRDIGQGVLFLGKLCFIKHGFTFDSINESSLAITEMRKTYFEDVFFDHNFRRAKELWDHLSDSDYEDQPSEYSVPSESDTSEDIPHYAIEARGAHFFY